MCQHPRTRYGPVNREAHNLSFCVDIFSPGPHRSVPLAFTYRYSAEFRFSEILSVVLIDLRAFIPLSNRYFGTSQALCGILKM